MPTTSRRLLVRALLLASLVSTIGLTGCGRNAVRASEKELLANQVMAFDADPHGAAADAHINSNREGAAGGGGTSGGGCGCN